MLNEEQTFATATLPFDTEQTKVSEKSNVLES